MQQLIFAASTQRTLGLTIAVLVALGFATYILFNIFAGKREIGAEVELAPNRKPYYDDVDLETKRLDRSLAAGVGTLAIIAVALPLYWLGEPGRHSGRDDFTQDQFARRGAEQYEALCSACHSAGAVGGAAPYTVLDEASRFVTTASWSAPALNTILYRFSVDEVTHILNWGRPQSPMPAWGGPGGGPLTAQQLEELIEYLKTIQLSPEEMSAEVHQGLRDGVLEGVGSGLLAETAILADADATDAEKAAAQEAITAAYNDFIPGLGDALERSVDDDVETALAARAEVDALLDNHLEDLKASDFEAYGGLLFNNAAGAGAYGCARCHTSGASWDADGVLARDPALTGLIEPEVAGGGGFGPSLLGVESQFAGDPSDSGSQAQVDFVKIGCNTQTPTYGRNGVCEPSGQMPGFGPNATDFAPAGEGLTAFADHSMLSDEQIEAIVAYERGLN